MYKNKKSKFKTYIPVEFTEDSSIPPLAFRVILYLYSKRSIKNFIIRKTIIRKLLGSKGNYEKCMIELTKLGYVYKKNPKSTNFTYRKLAKDLSPILEPQGVPVESKSDEKLDLQGSQHLDPLGVYIDIKSLPKGRDFKKKENYILNKSLKNKNSISATPLSPVALSSGSGLQTQNSQHGLDSSISSTGVVSRLEVSSIRYGIPFRTNLSYQESTIALIDQDTTHQQKIKPRNRYLEDFLKNKD